VSIWTDRAGRLHIGVMVGGKRIHRRLPEGSTKGDAKAIEAELRRAAGRRDVVIPGDPPLSELLALYVDHASNLRSPETARFHALRAGPWCVGLRASEAPRAAAAMISDMRGHYRPATINRSLGALKKALRMAFESGRIPSDYGARFHRLPENNIRHSYLTVAEVRKLAECASDQVKAAIWIALLTGCRRGEILKLAATDIQGKRLRVQAGNTKTLRERVVPIVPALRPWLEVVPLTITAEGLKTGFRRAREAAGLRQARFHDLRHSCASLLVNLGTPLEVVRDILGHTSVRTTERYSDLSVARQTEALGKLSRKVAGANRV